jgi:hypothetical protein
VCALCPPLCPPELARTTRFAAPPHRQRAATERAWPPCDASCGPSSGFPRWPVQGRRSRVPTAVTRPIPGGPIETAARSSTAGSRSCCATVNAACSSAGRRRVERLRGGLRRRRPGGPPGPRRGPLQRPRRRLRPDHAGRRRRGRRRGVALLRGGLQPSSQTTTPLPTQRPWPSQALRAVPGAPSSQPRP